MWVMLVVYLECSMAQPLSNNEPFVDITDLSVFPEKLRKTPLQVCNPINGNHIQNQLQKGTGIYQMSHKKKDRILSIESWLLSRDPDFHGVIK